MISEAAAQMFGLDQSLLLEWISAWLVLNWGAHLALSRQESGESADDSPRRQFPGLSEQFRYALHALAIGWLIRWSWQLLPAVG